jgi:TatD DNase family protein
MFINIHTHKQDDPDQFYIENLYKDFEKIGLPGFYSAGLHPWYLTSDWQTQFAAIEKYAGEPNLAAIGECGLDRVTKTNFNLQQEVFAAHISLANKINKPLIIHCVRAYDEVISGLKKQRNKVAVIFHGFNKNADYLKKILSNGHSVSFGEALLDERNAGIFSTVPMESFFLETDDAATDIREIYAAAAAAKDISLETLSLQLHKNLKAVFNIEAQ